MRIVIGTTTLLTVTCGAMAGGGLLHDNSDMITHPGQGGGGADVSMTSVSVNTAGSNVNETTGPYRIADVFWVDSEWEVDRIRLFVYSTGGDPNNPQFTGFNAEIWDGLPAEGGSLVAASDTFTNLEWTGIYRVFNGEGNLGNTDRPIMQVDIEFDGVELEPGYHWFSWQAAHDGSAWAPYVMEPNPNNPFDPITVEGTGWQETPDGWQFMSVGAAERQPSMPVQIYGTSAVGECPEDLTGSGNVGGADLGTLLAAWGPCDDPDDCPEDLTGSGSVGGADLGTLLAAWGPCPDDGLEPFEPEGACCLNDGSCVSLLASECLAEGGQYTNDFIPCPFAECPAPPLDNCCCPEPGQVGCEDEACETAVCDVDPFCCSFEWDASCVAIAENVCEGGCEGFCLEPTEADYQYDIGEVSGALSWVGDAIVGWAQRYEAQDGSDTLTNIATTFGGTGNAGVNPGDPVGVAVMEDTGAGPGATIWYDNTSFTADASAIDTGELQIFDIPDLTVEGTFYIAVWVYAPDGTFPGPRDNESIAGSANISIFSSDVWMFGESEYDGTFEDFDPDNFSTGPLNLHASDFPDVWVLRGNQPD